MSPLNVNVNPDDPRERVLSRLTVACPVHPDNVIVSYLLRASGQITVAPTAGWSEEFLSAGDVGEPVPAPLASYPVEVDPEGKEHLRERFRCLRPSCDYNAPKRCDGPDGRPAQTRKFLEAMASIGVTESLVTSFEHNPVPKKPGDPHWKVSVLHRVDTGTTGM